MSEDKDMRLYISADIEGIAGVVSRDQGGPGAFEYGEAREWMTGEVRAACEAAFENGVKEVVVSDSHGNGQNILPDKLLDNVRLVRCWPRPLGMMQGIEFGKYIGAMFIGYHAGSTNSGGVLSHTVSSKAIREIRINGTTVSEADISAAIAAHFEVPVIFASGDDCFVKEICETHDDIETIETKQSLGTWSACTLTPHESRARIRQGVATSLARLGDFNCKPVQLPLKLSVSFKHRLPAELLNYLSLVSRTDAFTVEILATDMPEAAAFIAFITKYQPTLL